MTDCPTAYTVHDGNSRLPEWRRKLIAAWLTANDIAPADVSADHSISILTVPFRPPETADDGGPWLVQVIVLNQYFTGADGAKEQNLLTHKVVTFQRTVPLKTPFPADPAKNGEDHGETDRQAAQEPPEVEVRPAWQAPLSDRHQGSSSECAGPRSTDRSDEHPEDHPREGHEALAQPEEDRQQPGEEVKP